MTKAVNFMLSFRGGSEASEPGISRFRVCAKRRIPE
jgi:hypothetical protein